MIQPGLLHELLMRERVAEYRRNPAPARKPRRRLLLAALLFGGVR